MDPSSFNNECPAPAPCSSGATSSDDSISPHLVVEPVFNNRCGSSCTSPLKATALAERSGVPRQPFSSKTRASLHNASQPFGTSMSSKTKDVFSFADGECSTDAKSSSPLFGDHVMSTQVFSARNDKKHGGRDKTDPTGTSTPGASKPFVETGSNLKSDVRHLNAEMPTVCGTKERFSIEYKCIQESNFKGNKAPVQKGTEALSCTNVPTPFKSSKPATIDTSVTPVPEVYIDGLQESKAEDKNALVKDDTRCIVVNYLPAQQSLAVLEDSQKVRDTSMEFGVSSEQVPPPLHLAACDMPSKTVKSVPASTPPAGSLGTGAGARPKTGPLRVIPARSKTLKEENMQLCEPREPRPRCLTSVNSHTRPSRRGSASIDSSRADSEFFAAMLHRENFLKESCPSSEEQSTSMQQMRQNNGKQFAASKTSGKKSFALKLSGLEPGRSTQHTGEFRSWNKEQIHLKSFRTDVAKNRKTFSESFEPPEVQHSSILRGIEDNYGFRRDSMEEMQNAHQAASHKRSAVETQLHKTTRNQAEYYGQVMHPHEETTPDLDMHFKEKNGFETKKQKVLDTLPECSEEKLRFEGLAMEVDPREIQKQMRARELKAIKADLQELRDRISSASAQIARIQARIVMLEIDGSTIRERCHGG
ncbi:hypothetical protein HPB50_027986 [Hyalomma asiaticum]|nr:hypothetical protein HPB50_027986 [Hyalomma asiaticum]